MSRIKYFLFIIIIFITPNVFARDYNINNKVYYQTDMPGGTYGADEIMMGGQVSPWSIGTRYQGCISKLSFYTDFDFDANKSYKITLNMATQDWRKRFMGPQVFRANSNGSIPSINNPNLATSSITYVSNYKIYFTFKTGSTLGVYTYFNIYSTNYMTTCMTGETNWNLSSIIISDSVSSTPTPAPVTPAPTPTPQPNNQDIINNNTQNTQDIIDNQNRNNQDVIDNANQNTQDIIDNQNKNQEKTNELLGTCYKNLFNIFDYDYSSTRYSKTEYRNQFAIVLTSNGNYTGGTFPLTYHLILKPNTTYYFKKGNSEVQGTAKLNYYVYHSSPNGTLVTYTNGNDDFSFTTSYTDYKDYYIRIYVTGTQTNGDNVIIQRPELFETNDYSFSTTTYIPYNEEKCINKMDELNSSITNDNIDSGVGNDFFDSFTNDMHGLSSIITIPLSSIQSLSSAQCSPLHIPIPFTDNKYLDLPCMTAIYQQHIPTLLTLIQTCWYGLLAYKILVDIFGIVKGFKDPDSDKIEVMDL